jgi:hypothetical protein
VTNSGDRSDQIVRDALKEFLDHASPDDEAVVVAMMDLLRGQPLGDWAGEHPQEFSSLARLMAFRDPAVPADTLPRHVRRFLLVWSYARQTLLVEI